jgi:hypothetical protein
MRRYFSNGSKTIGPKDINKNGQIESWEKARAKGMAKGMDKEYVDRAEYHHHWRLHCSIRRK